MKRGDFLKQVFTLVAIPTLSGGIIPLKSVNDSDKVQNEFDRIRFYGDVGKYRVGDYVMSDMGDVAVIVRVVDFGEPYVEARPAIRGQYKYKEVKNITVFPNAFCEKVK